MSGRVKISDVAKACGVSISCVSNILSGSKRYSFKPETVEKVRETARKMNYTVNPMASSFRTQKNKIIIGVLGSADRHCDMELMIKLKTELYKHGYKLVIQIMTDMTDEQRVDFLSKIYRWGEGLIIVSTGINPDSHWYPALQELLKSAPPSVNTSFEMPGTQVNYIRITYYEHWDRIGEFFHRHNCRKVLTCGFSNPEICHRAFVDAMSKYGITGDTLIFSNPSGSHNFYHAPARKIIELLQQDPDGFPQGIYCQSDETAYALSREFAAVGIRIPQDIVMLGGGDSDIRFRLSPALPVFVHDTDEQVRCAVADLLTRIQRGDLLPGTGRKIMDLEQFIKYPEENKDVDFNITYFKGNFNQGEQQS